MCRHQLEVNHNVSVSPGNTKSLNVHEKLQKYLAVDHMGVNMGQLNSKQSLWPNKMTSPRKSTVFCQYSFYFLLQSCSTNNVCPVLLFWWLLKGNRETKGVYDVIVLYVVLNSPCLSQHTALWGAPNRKCRAGCFSSTQRWTLHLYSFSQSGYIYVHCLWQGQSESGSGPVMKITVTRGWPLSRTMTATLSVCLFVFVVYSQSYQQDSWQWLGGD